VVVATGELQNPAEVMVPAALQRYKTSLTSDSTIHVSTVQQMLAHQITTQNATNTWKFAAKDISDMAVALSDHYDWDSGSVITDDKTGRRVNMAAFFNDASDDFHHDVQFGRYSLRWFSNNWPGVQYPFPKSTAVQGSADMEYPMMMNDSHQRDLSFAEMVQDHEQAHTYMPFYMGIDESFYAFMDEGWATTMEYLIGMTEPKGKHGADSTYKAFRINAWVHRSHDNEQPIITPLPQIQGRGGDNSYGKASMSYLALKDMLGDDLFKKALHTYMDNWHGKHPTPWDYFYSMNTGSGKNLNWFFSNWFYTPYYCDLSLENAKEVKGGYALSVKNIGGFAIPFDVVATYTDGTTETFHQTPIVWEKDQKAITVNIKTGKALKSATLDNGIYMDANEKDNTWPAVAAK
jgi:Peptidase family M1 domain